MEQKNKLPDKFDLSDSEDDNDIFDDIQSIKDNIKLFNNTELSKFPEPFNTIAQFIISSLVGVSISYIQAKKASIYDIMVDTYFKYCKNAIDDKYINDIASILKLDRTKKDDLIKFNILLDKISIMTKDKMKYLVDNDFDKYDKFMNEIARNLDIDKLNAQLFKDIIPLIKLDDLVILF